MQTNQRKALELLASAVAMLTNGEVTIKNTPQVTNNCCCNSRPTTSWTPQRPQTQPRFDREPDGVQVIVDRPRIENYGGNRQKWAMDMANYRALIDQAKRCDGIKTRVPEFIPKEVQNGRRDWYDDHGIPSAPQCGATFLPPFTPTKPTFGPRPCRTRIVEEWDW